IDTQLPQIFGIEYGKTYLQDEIQITILDDHLSKVTINGQDLTILYNIKSVISTLISYTNFSGIPKNKKLPHRLIIILSV
ncbi:MAG: hypothetical protein K2I03_10160, partial [Lachnospiraceae bacterium]|nr:hypothetical protein [Lachnospiraceae bacterium]